ncbi:MAG TPA: urea carboxylase, partial [Streptomyces sp.]
GSPTVPGDPLWDATPEGRRAFLNTAEYLTVRGIA